MTYSSAYRAAEGSVAAAKRVVDQVFAGRDIGLAQQDHISGDHVGVITGPIAGGGYDPPACVRIW